MREEDAGEDPVAAAEEKLHAIQRGFLTTVKSPPAVTGDVGEFLDKTARKVMEQASELMAKEGPETTPFKYKYEARELLVALLAQMHSCEGRKLSADVQRMLAGCIGRVEHLLGVNFYESEEVAQGEKHLMIAKDLLNDHHIEHMDTLNHLAMIWSTRAEYSKAEGFLQSAQELHDSFTATAEPASLVLSSAEQKQFTATLFLMAQVHQHLKQADKSARCCILTLDRQAQSLSPQELQQQGNEWISNAVQLSGYFLSQTHYADCATCLAAAESVAALIATARPRPPQSVAPPPRGARVSASGEALEGEGEQNEQREERSGVRVSGEGEAARGGQDELREGEDSRGGDTQQNEIQKKEIQNKEIQKNEIQKNGTERGGVSEETSAHLAWGWGKLHVARLVAAAARRRSEAEGLPEDDAPADPAAVSVKFSLPNMDKHADAEAREAIDSYARACAVVKRVVQVMGKVTRAFPLDGACTEHVQAAQDISNAYKSLVAFTQAADDVSKIHKRRIDLLEPLALALNPQCYDWLCKELWYEVGETYREMLDIKISQVDAAAKNISRAKLMSLGNGAVNAFRNFMALFRAVPGDKSVPDHSKPQGVGDAATRRWYLIARFGLARCISRIPVPDDDLGARKKAIAESLAEYKGIVDLMSDPSFAFPKDGPNFDAELQICKEMVELLPAKIARLHSLKPGRSGIVS